LRGDAARRKFPVDATDRIGGHQHAEFELEPQSSQTRGLGTSAKAGLQPAGVCPRLQSGGWASPPIFIIFRCLSRASAGFPHTMPPMSLPEHKRCLGCGYILDGLPEPRCPECGRVFDPVQPENSPAVLTRTAARHLLLALLTPVVCMLGRWPFGRLNLGALFAFACVNTGVQLYVAIRSFDELKKPWNLQPRRMYWQCAAAASVLFGLGYCCLNTLIVSGVSV
jgi:hypothetical protein